MSELAEFSNLARALAPWRAKIVFIGGWAFRLYSYEPRAWKSDHKPIFTQDADVAYAERERLEGDIKKALEGAGFKEEPSLAGGFKPPAMRYTLGETANGFYAEFLTPLTGSPLRRNKSTRQMEQDATEANAGVVAQKLRHLEVLLHEPWIVTIPVEESGLGEALADLRIPNPVSFMVQKLLIRDDRNPEKASTGRALYPRRDAALWWRDRRGSCPGLDASRRHIVGCTAQVGRCGRRGVLHRSERHHPRSGGYSEARPTDGT